MNYLYTKGIIRNDVPTSEWDFYFVESLEELELKSSKKPQGESWHLWTQKTVNGKVLYTWEDIIE